MSGAEVAALMATSPPDANFSADPLTGTIPLTVTGTSPMSNGLVITPNGVISATFGRAISSSTVSTRTFTVRGEQTGVYEGDYTFGSV